MKKILLPFLIVFTLAFAYLFFKDFDRNNDIIYYNGEIITMRDSTDRVEAIYVKNGKIIAVGSKIDILKNQTSNTQMFDLKGKTLMPGFFDAHGHFDLATIFKGMIDISGIKYQDQKDVWRIIEDESRKGKAQKWLFFYGFDPILTKNISSPTIQYLDSIAPNKPLLIITKALHVFYANTAAFKELGITNKSKNPSKSSYYERDEKGNLSGGIIEQEAQEPFKRKIQEFVKETFVVNTQRVLEDYASYGVTSVVNMGFINASKNILSLYEHMSAKKSKTLYNFLEMLGKLPERKPSQRIFLYFSKENVDLLPEKPKFNDDFYKIMGIKLWYDGSPYAGSMFLKQPYIQSKFTKNDIHLKPGHTGHRILNPTELESYIEKFQSKGWQVAIHSQGDIASEEVMGVFEKLHKKKPINQFRHRIEHCMLLPKSWANGMKGMNITPSFHINHLLYYGEFLGSDILGKERANLIFPIRSIAQSGMPYSLHADMPQFIPNPLSLASTSVNRLTQNGVVVNPTEKVSVWQALESITIDAAWQLNMDSKLGTIEKGKYADFVILDSNPLKISPEKLSNVKVQETIVAGNSIWKIK